MYVLLLCTKLHVYQCMQALEHSGSWAFIAINQRRIKFLLVTLGMPSECEGGVQHVVRSRCFYSSSSDRMQLCHTTIGPTVALCKNLSRTCSRQQPKLSSCCIHSAAVRMNVNSLLQALVNPAAGFCW